MLPQKIDYSVYRPPIRETIACAAVGGAAGFLTGYAFYGFIIVALLAAVCGAVAVNRIYQRRRIESGKRKLLLQFRDMLTSIAVSLGAGSNIHNAFRSAEHDMSAQHGEDSAIACELRIINAGTAANLNIEQLLSDFGIRSGIDEIKSFAGVFDTCFRLGGNIMEVVNTTCRVICDKIDTRQEILTVVSAKKSEQNAMLIMPVVFVIMLKSAGAGVTDMSSASGIASTTVAVILFIIAYMIGRKILRIEL